MNEEVKNLYAQLAATTRRLNDTPIADVDALATHIVSTWVICKEIIWEHETPAAHDHIWALIDYAYECRHDNLLKVLWANRSQYIDGESGLHGGLQVIQSKRWLLDYLAAGNEPIQSELVAAYPQALFGFAISQLLDQGRLARESHGQSFRLKLPNNPPGIERPLVSVDLSTEKPADIWASVQREQSDPLSKAVEGLGLEEAVAMLEILSAAYTRLVQLGWQTSTTLHQTDSLDTYCNAVTTYLTEWGAESRLNSDLLKLLLPDALIPDHVATHPPLLDGWHKQIQMFSPAHIAAWDETKPPYLVAANLGRDIRAHLRAHGTIIQADFIRGMPSDQATRFRDIFTRMATWGIANRERYGSTYRISANLLHLTEHDASPAPSVPYISPALEIPD
jgi:hypothetical protein